MTVNTNGKSIQEITSILTRYYFKTSINFTDIDTHFDVVTTSFLNTFRYTKQVAGIIFIRVIVIDVTAS